MAGRIRSTERSGKRKKQVHWNIGLYLRLSKEDSARDTGENSNENSKSIINQKRAAEMYFQEHFETGSYTIVETYIDDGVSGTTTNERAAFMKMREDIESFKINCVVCSDLSRAFRNLSDQSYFLEQLVPLFDLRFISLSDPPIDNCLRPASIDGMEVPIYGLMNERYAQRTSNAIKRAQAAMRSRGEFVGGFPPYGYMRDPEDNNHFVIDEEAAEIVRNIYNWFLTDGMTKGAIARKLTDMAIPSPTEYKRLNGINYYNPNKQKYDKVYWTGEYIGKMLKNRVYIGDMVQGKTYVVSYKVHVQRTRPEDEWTIVENTHEPIIDREKWELVQTLHAKDTRIMKDNKSVSLFAGFAFCHHCGRSLNRNTSRKRLYMYCKHRPKLGCDVNVISESELAERVLISIRTQTDMILEMQKLVQDINRSPTRRTNSVRLDHQRKKTVDELDKISKVFNGLYIDWKAGEIGEKQYRQLKEECAEKISSLEKAIAVIDQERQLMADGISENDPLFMRFQKYGSLEVLTRETLTYLVDKVVLYPKKEIEVIFKHEDYFRTIENYIANNNQQFEVVGRVG